MYWDVHGIKKLFTKCAIKISTNANTHGNIHLNVFLELGRTLQEFLLIFSTDGCNKSLLIKYYQHFLGILTILFY